MNFGKVSSVLQPWTNNPILLTAGIPKATGGAGRIGNTTAIFDAIYAACRYQFGKINHAASGNFILLFSDGEDDSSYLPLKQAVDMCQSTNTSIYAFRARRGPVLPPQCQRYWSNQLQRLVGGSFAITIPKPTYSTTCKQSRQIFGINTVSFIDRQI